MLCSSNAQQNLLSILKKYARRERRMRMGWERLMWWWLILTYLYSNWLSSEAQLNIQMANNGLRPGLTYSMWLILSNSASMRCTSAADLADGQFHSVLFAWASLYRRLLRRAISACSARRCRRSSVCMLIYSLRPWSFYTFCGLLLHPASACRASQHAEVASAVSLPAIRSCRIRLIQFYTYSSLLVCFYDCVRRVLGEPIHSGFQAPDDEDRRVDGFGDCYCSVVV